MKLLELGIKLFSRNKIIRFSFGDILNPLCPCINEAETTTHYFLRCHFYNANRSALMSDLNEIDSSFSTLNNNKFIDLILYDNNKFDDKPQHFNVHFGFNILIITSIVYVTCVEFQDQNFLV